MTETGFESSVPRNAKFTRKVRREFAGVLIGNGLAVLMTLVVGALLVRNQQRARNRFVMSVAKVQKVKRTKAGIHAYFTFPDDPSKTQQEAVGKYAVGETLEIYHAKDDFSSYTFARPSTGDSYGPLLTFGLCISWLTNSTVSFRRGQLKKARKELEIARNWPLVEATVTVEGEADIKRPKMEHLIVELPGVTPGMRGFSRVLAMDAHHVGDVLPVLYDPTPDANGICLPGDLTYATVERGLSGLS